MGDEMIVISPDLSYADTMKIRVSSKTTGGITPDVNGAETFGTIVSLNESPIRPGMLYAGTDDGRLWLSRNDGGNWEVLVATEGEARHLESAPKWWSTPQRSPTAGETLTRAAIPKI